MTFDEIYKQVENIPGWMGRQDCEALYNAVLNIDGLIVEIGSFMGRSTTIMAWAAPKSHIVAVDPYFTVHPSSGITEPIEAIKGFINNTTSYDVQLLAKKSEEIGEEWTLPIDFLHIDGDHHYESVKKDIELFVPHVKKGSYVYFHDYVVNGAEEDGGRVKDAVHDMAGTYFDEVKTVSGFAACRKK